MIAMQIARLIANYVVFLNMTDEDILELDASVQMMEILANDLEALDKIFLAELIDAFPIVALEYSGEAQRLVSRISRDFYLDEALAADNPVRLAELDAQREADD